MQRLLWLLLAQQRRAPVQISALQTKQNSNRMDSSSLTPQDCDQQFCQYHGKCVTVNGESTCECLLGYRGTFCEDRVSESIRVPLTLGVLGVLGALILLAFTCRFIWKRVKLLQRKVKTKPQRIPMVEIEK
ncbi:hypothetical protein GJAV_G00043270 [Gymnothorax javanicus]|nr:hypothetical protein GJAV_G00043270 [Gymnothorax javanicus]